MFFRLPLQLVKLQDNCVVHFFTSHSHVRYTYITLTYITSQIHASEWYIVGVFQRGVV